MISVLKALIRWLRFSVLGRARGIRIGRGCRIAFASELEGANTIRDRTHFSGRLGFGSYIGEGCRIYGSVGRFCSISADVVTILGKHPTSGFASTHPAFYSLRKQAGFTYVREQLFEENAFADPQGCHSVVIGHDVLISHGVRILEGVRIGDGAVLAAGCLVRTDVEPFAIYAGVPARKVGQRFDNDTIVRLLELRWWDRGEAWIKRRAPLFTDVHSLLASSEPNLPSGGA
jgi:acetyltransferase-like isoleucine patch superfamily enzyme